MYEYIKGTIDELTPTYVVIDAAGVGYYINISLQTFSSIEKLNSAKLYTHYIVREDAQILYGFFIKQEREIFRMLISVSGVGGNTARMILSTYSPTELRSIISTENATLLKNVKGLGLKTAQKIIVELKDKILGVTDGGMLISSLGTAPGSVVYHEAMAALSMLGFIKADSDKAVRAIIKENANVGVEDVIRMALKKM